MMRTQELSEEEDAVLEDLVKFLKKNGVGSSMAFRGIYAHGKAYSIFKCGIYYYVPYSRIIKPTNISIADPQYREKFMKFCINIWNKNDKN